MEALIKDKKSWVDNEVWDNSALSLRFSKIKSFLSLSYFFQKLLC